MTTTKTVTAALTAFLLTTGLSAGLTVTGGTPVQAGEVPEPITTSAPGAQVALGYLGAYEAGRFDESAAEITAVHGDTVFTVNAQAASVDIIDASDPKNPAKVGEITGSGTANSIAIREDGLGVIALENEDKTKPGSLMFFDARTTSATVLGTVGVGSLPDMVTITPDGAQALVANEGEPADDFSTDPEGSVGIVDLPAEVAAPTEADVRTADFREFEEGGSKTLPEGVRVFGPNPEGDLPVSRNLEPEYITVAGGKAYATPQEANAIAVVDIAAGEVERIMPLGFKDYGKAGNGLDPSDRDPKDAPMVNIATYPGLKGAYMPDTVSTFSAGGTDYLVTANEGDSREWGDFVDAARVKDLGGDGLAPVCETSPLADSLGDDELGRLNVITDLGLSEDGSRYEELYAFGGRSFSIWMTDGTLVADSGDEFEQMTAKAIPQFFNSNHTESNLEGRSDDKGPEPEALTIGQVGETTYAFVGFERIGGIAVYDLSDPQSPEFATYFNNRDFSVSVEDEIDGAADPAGLLSKAGDLGPEGITFLSAGSPRPGRPRSSSATRSPARRASTRSTTSPQAAAIRMPGPTLTEVWGPMRMLAPRRTPVRGQTPMPAMAVMRGRAMTRTRALARMPTRPIRAGPVRTIPTRRIPARRPAPPQRAADAGAKGSDTSADAKGSDAKDSDPKGGGAGGASAGSEGSADADDENAGSPPRTGADLGQYLLIGGVAAGLIALGVVAFLVTRRR